MSTARKNKWFRILWSFLVAFALLNVVAAFHAYKFTHFSNGHIEKTKDPTSLGTVEKISILVFGVSNPRPENTVVPLREFETIQLQSNKSIECWHFRIKNSKGTVVLFHGYGGEKSAMLDKSDVFLNLGYNTLLVDFMGSGGSEGNQTTVGYQEAQQVITCYDYLKKTGETKTYLFGTSMGAVAILKAIHDSKIEPNGIILECPFGSMYQTVCARFNTMKAPSFPMAGLLVFWGGVQNGFWAFDHNPTAYAKQVNCPSLLLFGARDEKVSRAEIEEIFQNLEGDKNLKIYPEAGHENYLAKYRAKWTQDVLTFLNEHD